MESKIYKALLFLLLGAFYLHGVQSQTRAIPNTIVSCYQNSTAYNRYTRQPMHIENLIAIIRKIEEKTNHLWTTRNVARTIIKQFQFDGLSFDPDRRQGFQFETDALDDHRNAIVLEMLPGEETLPDGVLDNDEKCALHWMLSHSINATLRDDEVTPIPIPGNNYGYLRAKREAGHRERRSPYEINDETNNDYNEREIETDEDELDYADSKKNSSNSAEKKASQDVLKNLQKDPEHYDPNGLQSGKLTSMPVTKKPLETGVIYTKWGAIAGGQLLGGIAAGLEPDQKPIIVSSVNAFSGQPAWNPSGAAVPTNSNGQWSSDRREPMFPRQSGGSTFRAGRRKRQTGGGNILAPLINYHAATLAGDVGQAAILNAVFQNPSNAPPPGGQFNDSLCPREYVLDSLANQDQDVSHDHDTWSYMTAAEIRGGVDGLVLGSQLQDWNGRYNYRLSEILDMYYSEKGIVGQPRFRACNRQSVFSGAVDSNTILEQSRSFAYLYNNRTSKLKVATAENVNVLYNLVTEAHNKMMQFAGSIGTIDPPCIRRESSGGQIPEAEKFVPAATTIYVVVDPSDTTDIDANQQKRFAAQLAYEMEVNKFGSRLGLVNLATGQILVKPNFTDSAPILSCSILSQRIFASQQQALVTTLRTLQAEFVRLREEAVRLNYQDSNGVTVLILNQGKKFDVNTGTEVTGILRELERDYGDVHVMYVTTKNQISDYDGFVLNRDRDVVRIQTSANLSVAAVDFAKQLKTKTHGRITYTLCNTNRYDQTDEDKIATNLFISQNAIQYYKISPDYFYSAVNLRLRFSSTNGRVSVCESRWNEFPNAASNGSNNVWCRETSGTYQTPGSGTQDLELGYNKPCGGDGKRDGCSPIYLSITPVAGTTSESDRLDCAVEGCQYEDQVKVTFSHWDMRCNSNKAVHTLVSLPGLFIALLLSVVTYSKYS